MFNELVLFIISTLIFSILLVSVSYILSYKTNTTLEKLDLYECGFKSFEVARQPIDIKFFLVCFLFVIFDLESIYLLPWLLTIKTWGLSNIISVLIFIIILIIGYLYELVNGAFDWN